MSWLDALLGRLFNSGSELALGSGLNFTNGLRATPNPTTKVIDVDVAPGTVTPTMIAPEALNSAVPFTIHATYIFAASASDLALVTSAAFPFQIVDARISAEVAGGASLRLRSASGGGGAAYSSTYVPGAAAVSGNLVSLPMPVLAIGDSVYLRTDGAHTENGDVVLTCIRR